MAISNNQQNNQIYEDYWKFTNAFTDYNDQKFCTALELCLDFIDMHTNQTYSKKIYKELQQVIVQNPIRYVLVETLVFYAVAKWLGVGTALLLLLGVFFGGFLVALWQMSRLGRLAQRRGLSPRDSSRLLGDMGLVAAGTVEVTLPGFVSSVVGLVLIVPVTRAVVRRVVAKRLQERISVVGARSFERVYQSRPRTSYGSAVFHPENQ